MLEIYLGGGLFNAGERLHNLYLEKHLRALGRTVHLPQRRALQFFRDGAFDLSGVVEDCRQCCANRDIVFVGNLDGPDADSGTSVEYGIAIISSGHAVLYRTDFRTALDKEVGVNGMFGLKGTRFIYEPCFFTELEEVDAYYEGLAHKIHETVKQLENTK